jgi:hypothetical protein
MSEGEYQDTDPPSLEQREDDWRRLLYAKLDSMASAVNTIRTGLHVLIAMGAVALIRFW